MEIKILAGVCIVKDRKVLLLKHAGEIKKGETGIWGPPSGHGEESETIQQTAIRETKEECNLEVELTGIVQSGLYKITDGRNYLIVIYSAQSSNFENLKVDNKEILDYKWASIDEIQSGNLILRHPILKPIIINALEGKINNLDTFIETKIEVK